VTLEPSESATAGVGSERAAFPPHSDHKAPSSLDRPTPEFEILAASPVPRAAAPTLRFRIRISDASEQPVYTIALTALITIEPAKRRYGDAERERLVDLFGEPERWHSTTENFRWTQADMLVPRFTGETEFDLDVPCTYDHEIAAAKYFSGLEDGKAPLRFHFNGTVFYEAGDGKLQMLQVPWDCSVRFEMPVEVWRELIAAHYPFRRWIALGPEQVERLARIRVERGLPSFDAVIDDLTGDS
jgi:hypothetical protein